MPMKDPAMKIPAEFSPTEQVVAARGVFYVWTSRDVVWLVGLDHGHTTP